MREWLRRAGRGGRRPGRRRRGVSAPASGWRGLPRRGCATRWPDTGARRTSPTPSRRRWTAASPASPAPGSARSRSTSRPSGPSSWSCTTGATCGRCRDHVVASLEPLLPWLAKAPVPRAICATSLRPPMRSAWSKRRAVASWPCAREIARRGVGLGDAVEALSGLSARRARGQRAGGAGRLHQPLRRRRSWLEAARLLIALGSGPGWRPTGRTASRCTCTASSARFTAVAPGNAADAAGLAATGVRPGRHRSVDDADLPRRNTPRRCGRDLPKVQLLQEWLAGRLDWIAPRAGGRETCGCCPTAPSAPTRPARARTGRPCSRLSACASTCSPSGCCGMAGTYGHEAEHRATSERDLRTELGAPRGRVGPARAGCWPTAIPAGRRPSSWTESACPIPSPSFSTTRAPPPPHPVGPHR